MFLACRSWACQSSQITHALLTLRSFRYMSLATSRKNQFRTDTRSGSCPAAPHIDSGYPGPQASWYCQETLCSYRSPCSPVPPGCRPFFISCSMGRVLSLRRLTHITGISAAPYNRQIPSSCTGGQLVAAEENCFICQLLYTVSCGFLRIFPKNLRTPFSAPLACAEYSCILTSTLFILVPSYDLYYSFKHFCQYYLILMKKCFIF